MSRLAVSVPEAADMLGGVHVNTIWSLLRRNELPRVKVGSRTLIPVASIEEFLANGEGRSEDQPSPPLDHQEGDQ